MIRRAPLFALGLALGLALAPRAAPAAGKDPSSSKRCIDSAEEGQRLRANGRLVDAKWELRRCTAAECPAVVRRDCAKWVDELDEAIPTVIVRVVDGRGRDVVEGRLLLDGEPLADRIDGRAMPIDPGKHRFAWTDGKERIEEEAVIRESERGRTLVLRGASAPAARPPPAEPPSAPILALGLGGAGLVFATAGAIFWGVGASARADMESTCAPRHACSQGDVDRARSKLIVGDVLVGVGVVTLAAGVYFYLKGESSPPPPRTAAFAW